MGPADRLRTEDRRRRWTPAGVVVAASLALVVALRVPFLTQPLGQDEAGFMTVAAQWRPGTSLYGDYWVDRPPLLIAAYRLADGLGGTVALRVLGLLAALVAVAAASRAVWRLAGPRGGAATAVVVAALLVSPLTGALEVNGELLAAPLVALGTAAAIEALLTDPRRRGRVLAWSVAAGLAAAGAVMVKQNMVDVLVFAAVAGTVVAVSLRRARRRGTGARIETETGTTPRLGAALPTGLLVGLATGLAAVLGYAATRGTTPAGVWFAMYPFRVDAGAVMAAHPSSAAPGRGLALLAASAVSGLAAAALLHLAVTVRARRGRATTASATPTRRDVVLPGVRVGLVAVLGYDAVSIAAGGSWWIHYAVQAVVPAGLAVGLAAASRIDVALLGRRAARLTARRVAGVLTGVIVLVNLGAVVAAGTEPISPGGNPVGAAIGRVARPDDTIVTVWGHADVTHASGLSSPYPYLWSIPERTLDPRLQRLTGLLAGRQAPTWFVSFSGPAPTLLGVDTTRLDRLLARRYHLLTVLDGSAVYLLDHHHRPVPSEEINP